MDDLDAAIDGMTQKPAAEDDPIGAAVDNVISMDKARTGGAIRSAVAVNPDQAAKAVAIAKRAGLPRDLVMRNLPEMEAKDMAARIEAVSERSEVLSSMFRNNPGFGQVAHDDVDNLSAIERVWRGGKVYGGAAAEGVVGKGAGAALTGLGRLNEIAGRAIGSLLPAPVERALQTPIPDWLNPGYVFGTAPGETLKSAGSALGPGQEDRNFGTDVAEGVGQVGFQIASALLTGGASSAAVMGAQGVDAMSEKVEQDDATQADKDVAVLLGAGWTAVTEKYGLDKLLNRVPPAMKNAALRKIADVAAGAGIEAAQEMAEGIGQDVIRRVFTDPDAEIGSGIVNEGSVAGAVGGIVRAALGVRSRGNQVRQAKDTAESMSELDKLAQENKVRERSPGDWQAFMQSVSEGGPVNDVYIDARDLDESALRKLVEASPSAAQQAAESMASGVDMQIPAAEFGANVFGQGFAQSIIPHLKTDPNGMSLTQADAAGKTEKQDQERVVTDTLAHAGDEDAWAASRAVVEADVLRQLNETGRLTEAINKPNAALWAARYATLGARLGITPEEAYKRFPATITATPPAGAALEQPAYHGSPHRGIEQFTTQKMGTGEGAQAYGWGMYFAQSKDIAEFYRKTLSEQALTVGGAPIDATNPTHIAAGALNANKGDVAAAIADLESSMAAPHLYPDGATAVYADAVAVLQSGVPLPEVKESAGQLYEVEVPDDGDMLDYDAALKDQPEKVRKALEGLGFPAEQYRVPLDNGASAGLWNTLDEARKALAKAGSSGRIVNQPNSISGAKIYSSLQMRLGSDEAASRALFAAGIPGLRFLDASSRGAQADSKTRNYVIFDDSAVKKTGEFYQMDQPVGPDGPQSPEARGLYTPAAKNVALLERANFSSFVHESGHLFLDQTAEIASREDAPADIMADMGTLLDWFGIRAEEGATQLEVWQRMTLEQQREHHEKFARGFEAFAWEGKAPSVALAGAFQRFRGWLRNLYRSLTSLNVQLTDEVRAVMSRMIATDEEIAQAKAAQSMGMMFDQAAAEKLGIDYRAYQAQDRDATDEAASELDKRRLGDLKWYETAKSQALRELQRDAVDKRREVKAEARGIVMSRPVYRAWAFLTSKSGEAVVPGVTPVLQADETELAGKLRTSALKEMFGDAENAVWRKLEKLRMTKEAGGMHPDVAAELFGYDSGEAMVDALRMAQTPSEAVEAQTDAMMLERYGDITSQEALERAATEAVHNKARTRVIATELTALEKAAKVAKKTVNDAARAFAAQLVGRQKVGDLKPEKFEAAARKASIASLKAFKAGDIQKAATEKRNELINTYAARAAREARDKTQSILKYFKRIDTEGARKNRRGEFLEQRDALLARFDLRTSLTRAQIDAKTPLADWVKAESERLSAVQPDLPGWVLDETNKTHYKTLTVDDFSALKDSVEQLDNLAKREQKQYMAIRQQSFDEEKGALLDKLRATQPHAFDSAGVPLGVQPDFVPSIGKGLEKMGDKFVAEFLSVENIIGVLEGKTQGAVWESLFGRISRQSDAKAERLGKIFKQMKPLFDQYSYAEKVAFSRKDIGTMNGIGIPMTRENALVTALLNGNKEGRDRLANYGWSQQTIQSIVDMLDPKDIKLAEGIWTMFDESLWPELKALNDRTKGASPPKVEAMKFNAKGGELRGGYFPLRYNTDLDERAQRYDESQSVADMLGGSALGMSAKTRQGTSQSRVDGVKMRPRLDLQVFSEVVNETVHDIAYREAVADTMRMLNDTDVQNALKVAAGVQSYRAMVTRVRETAAPPRNPSGFIEKTLSIARKNTIVTLMSGVKTALQNFTGLFPAMAKVGPGVLSREFGKFFSPNMLERTRFAMDQSAYLRGRFDHYDRDLQTEASRLTVNGKIMPDTAYFLGLMGLVDLAVTVPVWNAAFAEGMAIHGNDQARAVDYADSVVRTTQGSGRDVDLAKIQSGHGGYGQLKRVFTMFYSYFSGQLGLLVQTGAVAKQEAKTNPSAAVAKFTAKFVAIVVIPTVLTEVLMNGPGGSDDEDNQVKRWAKVFGRYGASLFPVVRDFYSYAVSKFDPDAKFHGASFRLSPVEAAFEGVGVGIKSGIELADGGGDIKDAKGVIMGLGFLLGLPGKLVSDTVAGTNAWLDGTAGPEAVVLGPPKAK